jgi:hypothetical protein
MAQGAMTDQSVPTVLHRAPLRVRSGELQPGTSWSLAGLCALALASYVWLAEGRPATVVFAASVAATIISALVFVTRRVLFATVLVAALAGVIVTVASIKRQIMNMVVHAYDLVFYLSSWSTLIYLWADHRRYVVGLACGLLAAGLLGWIAYRLDGTRIRRAHAAAAIVVFATLASLAASAKGERRHMEFSFAGQYLASFFSSWSETIETLLRGQLIEAAQHASGPPLRLPTTCHPATRPPHIILIHQESVVPPSHFPSLRYDRSVEPFFRSLDGKLHRLRVETYGGASWLTEFSILTGVSTYSFGGMRQFVQNVMENRIRDALPEALARCDYRNVLFYPMWKNFVSNARFFESVGLREIFDMQAQGAKTANERDRFYYANALAELERHLASSSRPLFTYVQTMAAHWPYHVTFWPEVEVPGGGPGTHPELHEYLRRLSMAKLDYDFLKSELARRFPAEPFLILHYGDHHPVATRLLLGFGVEADAEDVLLDPESIGFITYYAVDAINYRPPPLPKIETLDVPYLGTVLLELARLPLSDAHRERMRLMQLCRGRYYGCARRDEILAFHRRLIDSGLMAAR